MSLLVLAVGLQAIISPSGHSHPTREALPPEMISKGVYPETPFSERIIVAEELYRLCLANSARQSFSGSETLTDIQALALVECRPERHVVERARLAMKRRLGDEYPPEEMRRDEAALDSTGYRVIKSVYNFEVMMLSTPDN